MPGAPQAVGTLGEAVAFGGPSAGPGWLPPGWDRGGPGQGVPGRDRGVPGGVRSYLARGWLAHFGLVFLAWRHPAAAYVPVLAYRGEESPALACRAESLVLASRTEEWVALGCAAGLRRARACLGQACFPRAPAALAPVLAHRKDDHSHSRQAAAASSALTGRATVPRARSSAAPLRARSPCIPLLAAPGALAEPLRAVASARRDPGVVAHLRAPAVGLSLSHCRGCGREARRHSQ